jgi:hypothetical protein
MRDTKLVAFFPDVNVNLKELNCALNVTSFFINITVGTLFYLPTYASSIILLRKLHFGMHFNGLIVLIQAVGKGKIFYSLFC